MARFNEGGTVSEDGLWLIATIVVLFSGIYVAEWAGSQTGSKWLSAGIGVIMGLLFLLIRQRFRPDEDDAEFADEERKPWRRIAKVAERIFVIVVAGFLIVQIVRKAMAGLSYFDATWSGLIVVLALFWIVPPSHNPFRRPVSP